MSDPKPYQIGYNPYHALSLAKASKLAYFDQTTVVNELQTYNINKLHFFDYRNTQGFIAGNNSFIIISFRGTEPNNLKDWMTDAEIHMVKGYGGYVHSGFSKALDDVWGDIITQIPLFQDQNQPIFLTGHSFGGALATMTGVRLGEKYYQQIKALYTFGCPRVGDRNFADNYDKIFSNRTFRMVNHRDIVTRLAPRIFGYRHVGGCWFFDCEGRLHNDIRYWKEFLEAVKGTKEEFLNVVTLITDHNLDEYKKNVLLNFDVMDTGISFTNIRRTQKSVMDMTLKQTTINPATTSIIFSS